MTEKEKPMTTRIATAACGNAGLPWARLSLTRLLKIAAAIAIAFVVMYAETWAIQESPIWSSACAVTPASAASGETDGPFRDTAGPIAVLH
jgi:hypothetical protein